MSEEKYETIELDLDDNVLFKIALSAHEEDITLNQYIVNLLKDYIKQQESYQGAARVEVTDEMIANDEKKNMKSPFSEAEIEFTILRKALRWSMKNDRNTNEEFLDVVRKKYDDFLSGYDREVLHKDIIDFIKLGGIFDPSNPLDSHWIKFMDWLGEE